MTDLNRKGDILKVRLGDDVRRMVLYNTHISYDDLVLMLQRVYDGKLKSSDDVALKYYDEDNDLITIADDSDFAHAREYAPRGVVKMVVYVNGQDRLVDAKQLLGIRKELADVRDKVNSLVDALDSARVAGEYSSTTTTTTTIASATQESNREWAKKDEQKIPPQAASMFDPLAASSIQTSTVMTTLSTVTGTVSSTHVDTSSGVAGQSEAGASHLFAGSQDGSSLFSQASNLTQPLSQSQSGSYYSPPQAITSASAPPPSSSPQPPSSSSSSYPAAQTGQPSYPSQPQTGSHQPYPSSYAAQPSAPSVASAPVSNPSSYPPASVPNPSQYPPTSATNPSGFTQGSYPQTVPGSTAPYPGPYAGSNVGGYPPQGSPYPPQPGAASGRYPAQQYGRPYKIGY